MDSKVIYVDFTKPKRSRKQNFFKFIFLNILKNVFHISLHNPSKKNIVHPLHRNNIKVKL